MRRRFSIIRGSWLALSLLGCAQPAAMATKAPVSPSVATPVATATPVPTTPAATPPVAAAAATPTPPPPLPPSSDAPTTVMPTSLGWPAETKIVKFTETAHIFAGATEKSAPLGKVVRGTKTAWTRFVDLTPPEAVPTVAPGKSKKKPARKSKQCQIWVEIAPMGWVCARSLAATKDSVAVAVAQPELSRGEFMPGAYYLVRDGAAAYGTPADVKANNPRPDPLEKTMLRGMGTVDVDGVTYQRTNKGLVEATQMSGLSPSDFAGIDLRTTPQTWPFAMVSVGKRGPAVVRVEPNSKSKKVRTQAWRSVVPMGTEQDGFVNLGENQWIARSALRVFTKQKRPAAVAADGQWIDVDLDEQTVVAYQGDTPIFASVVSTGRVEGTTPVGLYRIVSKAATMRMAGEPGTNEKYDVGEIPWAMRFKKGVFFHASYWHDGFGTKHSHGCVNLSPRDARFLYTWAGPAVPDGWSELEALQAATTIVRVRNAGTPEPSWYNYSDEPKATVEALGQAPSEESP